MRGLIASVIIPCYNEQRHIQRCLETVTKQTLENFEVIVVDDGSTDNTREIVRKFSVQLLEQNHKGPGAARNYGAQAAKGDVLVFADADQFFDPHYLEGLVNPILEGKAIGTGSKDEFLGNSGNVWAVCWNYEQLGAKSGKPADQYPVDSTVFRALRREDFLRVGGFDTEVGYEDDLTLSTKLKCRASFVPGAVYFYTNPETLSEVFIQARWLGRGNRFVGHLERLIKYFIFFSVFFSLCKAFKYKMPQYFVFKICYDFGTFVGGISRLLTGKHVK